MNTWFHYGIGLALLTVSSLPLADTTAEAAPASAEVTAAVMAEAAADGAPGNPAPAPADTNPEEHAAAATVGSDTSADPQGAGDNPVAAALGQADLSPWGMYQAADWVVKSVMILLVVASMATWAVWLGKQLQLVVARRRDRKLLVRIVNADTLAEVENNAGEALGGVALLAATRHELAQSARGPASDEGIKERVQARLERVQAALGNRMSKGTGLLATIGSVAPFVGLFGTVWGIMNAFIGIAHSQTTNLAVVAPGIAEALLATAIGLVAAIPAVVVYNHFARAIGDYRALLADMSVALLVLVSRDLDRKSVNDTGDMGLLLRKTG